MAYGYADYVKEFIVESEDALIGKLQSGVASTGVGTPENEQFEAWRTEIQLLKRQFTEQEFGNWFIILEYEIPRRSRRPDLILLSETTIYVVELKIHAERYDAASRKQSKDYALDLRDFHAGSHGRRIVPILCATGAAQSDYPVDFRIASGVSEVVRSNGYDLTQWLRRSEQETLPDNNPFQPIDPGAWLSSSYRPTLDIIEAARTLYAGHGVREIAHSYAHNLGETVSVLAREIEQARETGGRTICFVTGVPGAGKTLTGLEIVHDLRVNDSDASLAVFLSGNGPLVDVIQRAVVNEQLERQHNVLEPDRVVRTLIQNVHGFLRNHHRAIPPEHIVVFDEAQRAWNHQKVARARGRAGLEVVNASEPQLFLDVMEQVSEWAVIIALVGGGQEIHDGEAGLEEWGRALEGRSVPWRVVAAPEALIGGDSVANHRLFSNEPPTNVRVQEEPLVHLDVVVRSHRAQQWAEWVNLLLNLNLEDARSKFPRTDEFECFVTRGLEMARSWLRQQHDAEPRDRTGLVATSQDLRLRSYGIERSSAFRSGCNFPLWFLADHNDVRSSTTLEIAASEFECQGLELDWVGLCWGGDLVPTIDQVNWEYRRFHGADWQDVKVTVNQEYARNRYRVLLTRAGKGMVIWVPPGDLRDTTRDPERYDRVFKALQEAGVPMLDDTFQADDVTS